jgi:hypothetical protein
MSRRSRPVGASAERKASRRNKLRLHPGSGNIPSLKADMSDAFFIVESKATEHDSISIKKKWLDKVADEGRNITKAPVLLVQFVKPDGEIKDNGAWVMMPEWLWRDIRG